MHIEQTEDVGNLREILGGIIALHGGRWRRYISAILRNHADAEDVVQEAVGRMLTRDQSFLSEADVRQYLGRAIINAALELYNSRKRERRNRIPVTDYAVLPGRLPSPYDCMEEREESAEKEHLISRLQEALAQIPPKQIEALRLTIMEPGSSIRDVGMNHGIPYSTLRHRSKQGLRALRKYLRVPLAGGRKNI